MSRCLQLAANGMGTTRPNPMVGSVVVYKDTIIGEGWHLKPGDPHAEVNAINSVQDKSLLRHSTLYVNLEPCSHFGRTPPCADLIITSKIPTVVIGTVDPHAIVKGAGIKKLLDSGIDVVVGVLENECTELNKRFFTFMQNKRPYIILKWAESADGFIAPERRLEQKPVWITNLLSRQLVHKWRSEEHAILVGTQTVLDDNPELTVREWTGNNPIRVVLDFSSRADKNSLIFNDEAKTILITGTSQFAELSHNVIIEKVEKIDVKMILEVLYNHAITSVIVEGGSRTLQSFIDENLWDEARVFLGNKMFGSGIKAPQFKPAASDLKLIGEDRLSVYKNCAE